MFEILWTKKLGLAFKNSCDIISHVLFYRFKFKKLLKPSKLVPLFLQRNLNIAHAQIKKYFLF